ncbi:hypothetical protein OC846_000014 [Tilletia horrida]|uniref:25S rRNA (uridine-N(3))-methyltransferase BMT5-like domain-containing protein n=1 Tax=Tilletia horrida TaxID=155126 RepID=A0AAN6GWI3_9BASI|nr:hypothetical protein OC846_000014 [Tilletia horrida]
MPKKKGNLQNALQAHSRSQDQKARAEAAAQAQKRKLESIKTGGSKQNKDRAQKRRKTEEPTSSTKTGSSPSRAAGTSLGQPKSPASGRQRRQKVVQPFASDDSILLVGEGKKNFARTFLWTTTQPPHSLPAKQILATAYDTEEECYRKYPDAEEHISKIRHIARQQGITYECVAFGIDAGNLTGSKMITGGKKGDAIRRFSKIWFGFPHVGAGHKDETRNILANQLLLLRFFVSAASVLTKGPMPAWAEASTNAKRKRKAADSDDEAEEQDDDDDFGSDDETGPYHSARGPASTFGISHMIAPNRAGSVLVTLRNCSPYTKWDVPTLAKRAQAMLPIISRSAPSLPKGQRVPSSNDLASAFPDVKKSYAVIQPSQDGGLG